MCENGGGGANGIAKENRVREFQKIAFKCKNRVKW